MGKSALRPVGWIGLEWGPFVPSSRESETGIATATVTAIRHVAGKRARAIIGVGILRPQTFSI
jgi:hypothetical protein